MLEVAGGVAATSGGSHQRLSVVRHVAWVLPQYRIGGAELVASHLVELVRARGVRASYVSIDCVDEANRRLAEGIGVVDLMAASGRSWLNQRFPRLLRVHRLRRWLEAERPDAVVAFLPLAQAVSLVAAHPLGIPVVLSERIFPPLDAGTAHWRWFVSRLEHRAAGLVVLDSQVRPYFPRVDDECVHVIVNPVQPAISNPDFATGKWIVGVGRLHHQKRFDLLLSAFARAGEALADWNLVIWGEGEQDRALRQQAERLGLGDRVRFPGRTVAPRVWLPACGIFVLCSDYEGFPNALAEAMAAGMPVVATDCPTGPSGMIRSGTDGILIPKGDVGELVNALRTLALDGALRARLGAAAVKKAAAWAPDRIAESWLGAIEAAVRRARTQGTGR